MNLRTGSELVSASTPGNAEEPDHAKDKAGATVMMPARKFTNEEKIIRNEYALWTKYIWIANTEGHIIEA